MWYSRSYVLQYVLIFKHKYSIPDLATHQMVQKINKCIINNTSKIRNGIRVDWIEISSIIYYLFSALVFIETTYSGCKIDTIIPYYIDRIIFRKIHKFELFWPIKILSFSISLWALNSNLHWITFHQFFVICLSKIFFIVLWLETNISSNKILLTANFLWFKNRKEMFYLWFSDFLLVYLVDVLMKKYFWIYKFWFLYFSKLFRLVSKGIEILSLNAYHLFNKVVMIEMV